ncbi:transposase [Streptomyces scopuliridis]|uniref:transposase n=1 Tax=Streptomyces scopuliridis TaxID=452529 RepID=UPI0034497FC6
MLHPHGDSVLLDHQDPSHSGVQNPGSGPIALDVTPWPRPDAECSPERLHCHRLCRCDGVRRTIPGWPYQVAAALGGGRSSWTGLLDAV